MNRTLILFAFALMTINGIAQTHLREYYKLSNSLFKSGKYAEALKVNIDALKQATKIHNCDEIAYASMQVARLNYYLNDRKEALRMFKLCLSIVDSCQIDSLRKKVYHNIGSTYIDVYQYDSALQYLKKSLQLSIQAKSYLEISKTDAILAFLYLDKFKNQKEGIKYTNDAVENAYISKDPTAIAFAKGKLGMIYYHQKDYKHALKEYEEALQIYRSLNYTDGELNMIKSVVINKILLHDTSALGSYREYSKLMDSVFSSETAMKMADFKIQYETEKKVIENELLQQQNIANNAKIKNRNNAIVSLVIGILLIISIVVWRINIQNLKKKNLELESINALQKERERISRDLHDNVGGQLSYALLTLKGVNEEEASKRKAIEESIEDSLRNIIGNLRETIWAINDEAITMNDFSDKLILYSKSMFGNTQTKLIYSRQIVNDLQLKSFVGLNLYRICQEIINNAFKYAQANEININIQSHESITIIIRDNGIGFDSENIVVGFGLANIKNRAEEAGIKVSMSTSPSNGTTFTLEV